MAIGAKPYGGKAMAVINTCTYVHASGRYFLCNNVFESKFIKRLSSRKPFIVLLGTV